MKSLDKDHHDNTVARTQHLLVLAPAYGMQLGKAILKLLQTSKPLFCSVAYLVVSWALWRRGLNLLYMRNNKQSLRVPLGNWHPAKIYVGGGITHPTNSIISQIKKAILPGFHFMNQ
jgi:hypothetical protein